MTMAEIALMVFTTCNALRVLAYVPQIVRIGQDQQGAQAISYFTWILFAVSHLSTVFYALTVAQDGYMALVFVANTVCCFTILGMTAYKRVKFQLLNQMSQAVQGIARGDVPEPAGDKVVWLRRSEPQVRRFAAR